MLIVIATGQPAACRWVHYDVDDWLCRVGRKAQSEGMQHIAKSRTGLRRPICLVLAHVLCAAGVAGFVRRQACCVRFIEGLD